MHGGRRSGAGRPRGSPNKNQALLRQYAKKVAAGEGIQSPLETLLATMRYLHALAIQCARSNTVLIEDDSDDAKKYGPIQLWVMAAEVAAKAAPFIHPRLTAVDANLSGRIGLYEQSLLALANTTDATS